MRAKRRIFPFLVGLVCLLSVSVGCITARVKEARSALETARSAGKDKQCPAEFREVEQLIAQAEGLCRTCHPSEANALADQALAKASGLCPAAKVAAAPPPAPTPPPEPAPTASLSAAASAVEVGACTNLNWSTSNATNVSIDQGIGSVGASGSRQVCPSSTTRYTLTATGAGGSRSDSATVTVNPKPTPTAKLTIHVNFDTAKSTIRKADVADLKKAEEFVKKYPSCKIEVDGHTDSRGSDEYNQGLSERRADAVKKYLLDHGATSNDLITTKGFGESNPIADNATEKGRFENRRAEILIFCQ